MNISRYLNTGSGHGFHKDMINYGIIKFGTNPNKPYTDKSSYNSTNDQYFNTLIDMFVGVSVGKHIEQRLVLRALLAKELGMYVLTGNKTDRLVETVRKLDSAWWSNGFYYVKQLNAGKPKGS